MLRKAPRYQISLLCVSLLLQTAPAHAVASFWRESEHKAIEVQESDPDAAIAAYRLAIKDAETENAPVENRLALLLKCGELLYVNHHWAEAADIYQQGVSLAETNQLKNWQARFLVMISRNAHEMFHYGAAVNPDPTLALKALELRPGDPNSSTDFRVSALETVGEIYLDLKDYANADKYLKQALAEANRMPDEQELVDRITRSYLRMLMAQKKYAQATALLVASVQSHPSETFESKYYYSDGLNAVDQNSSFRSKIQALIKKRDFAGLDAMANEMRANHTPTSSGTASIDTFMHFMRLPTYATEQDFRDQFTFLNDWVQQQPNSATAKVVLADLFTDYAWKARGCGWASEVTDQGWYLMGKRLDQAWKILYKTTPKNPEWYRVAQTVALGKSWERGQYDSLVSAARKEYPNYNEVLFQKAYYLQPKWFGRDGEAMSFINSECSKHPGIEGDILYAQFAWNLDYSFQNVIKDVGFDWPRVKRGLIALVQRYPQGLGVKGELAFFAAIMGDKATALSVFPGQTDFSAPITIRPKGYWEAFEAGQKFQKDDKRPEAIAAYSKAIAIDPKGGEAYWRRAEMYVMTNRSDEARADINKCLSMYPAWIPALSERGRIGNLREEYPQSIADIEKVLAINPTEIDGLSTLGHDYDEMGDHQRALNVANHDVELTEQKNSHALYYAYMDRGLIWSNAHQYDQALSDLTKGIQLRRDWSQLWAYLAYIYAATDKIPKAEQTADVLFKLESFPPRGYRLRAEMYRAGGLWDKALADYNQSTSMEPTYGPGFWQRAVTKIAMGNYDSAESDLHKSVALRPTSALAYSYLAFAEDLNGKTDAAQTDIAKAFSLCPNLPMNYVNRARIAYHHGALTKAAADCDKALSIDPYQSEAYATAAVVLTAAGKADQAQSFDKAAKGLWWHAWQVPLPAPKVANGGGDVSITMPTKTELKPQPFAVSVRDAAP